MNTSVCTSSWLSSLMLNSICLFHSRDGDTLGLRKKGKENTVAVLMLFVWFLCWKMVFCLLLFQQLLPLIRRHRRCEVPLLNTACLAWDLQFLVAEKGKDGQWQRKHCGHRYLPVVLGIPNTHAKDTQGFWKCCTSCNNRLPTDITDTILYRRPKFLISA